MVLFWTSILASVYEFRVMSNKDQLSGRSPLSMADRVVIAFSIVSNTKAMFKRSAKKFSNIDFVRLVMLLQVTLMHQYYVYLFWSALPLTRRVFTGLASKVGTDYKYAFLRNVHNTDFFFALS